MRGIAYAAKAARSSSVRAKTAACVSSSSASSENLSRRSLASPSNSTSPPVAPSDHRGLDEEMFPNDAAPSAVPFPGRSVIGVVLCRLNGLEFFRGFLRRELSELGFRG